MPFCVAVHLNLVARYVMGSSTDLSDGATKGRYGVAPSSTDLRDGATKGRNTTPYISHYESVIATDRWLPIRSP